jgi:DNA-binding SARP family transcriptional activator
VRIHLLGGFRVEREGETVPDNVWQRRSGKMLAKMLAAAPEHRLHREVVMDRLWPDADPAAAGNSLHQALLAVRRVLDAARTPAKKESCLRLVGEMIVLAPESVAVDVDEFERLAQRGLRTRQVEELTAAAADYSGELLPEDRFEEWAEERREQLGQLYVQVLTALAETLERRGASFAAIDRAQQALAIDPTREDLHRLLMRLHAVSGQRHQALRQYRDCRQMLADELDVEPEDETEALYQDILAGKLDAAIPADLARPLPLPAVPRRQAHTLFAGRDRPLGILREKVTQLHAGSGGVVLVSGEAGVGKTRLAVEAALSADEAGSMVLWGTSYAEEGQLPYGAFAAALEEYFGALPAGARERLGQSYPELSRLVASVGASDPGSRAAEGTRMQLFAAIGRFLSEIVRTRPLVLVLDDLHAADEVSVQLLHYLARLAQQHPWLLVVTYREEEVRPGDALHGVVAACIRRGLADRIELLRLSRAEADTVVRSLLDGDVDESLLTELFSLSLGNALFLQELVHATRDAGLIEHVDDRWRAAAGLSELVPPGASELVTARASRLSKDAGRIASLAAVAGMECTLQLLREAGELSEGALIDGLDQIATLRIMEARPGDGTRVHRYAFRHPLFREALYAAISSPRRQHLHATIGRAMETVSPDEVDALAYQWSRTASDEKAIHYLELAGDRAMSRYAQEVAATYFREAMSRLGEADPARTARLQFKLGDVLIRAAQYDDAVLHLDVARRYYRETGNLEELARTVAALARTHAERGTAQEGAALVRELLPEIGDEGELRVSINTAIDLHIALTNVSRRAGDLAETVREAEKVAALARAAGNDRALAIAEGRRGDALGSMGHTDEGIRILEECRALAESVGSMITVAAAYLNAGTLYGNLGDIARNMEYRERAADLFERLWYPAYQAFALGQIAACQYVVGRWEEARHTVERVFQIHDAIDVSWHLNYALCTLGDIEMGSGELDKARECFDRAHTLATTRSDPGALIWVERGLAEVELLSGRPDAARARLNAFLAGRGMEWSDVIDAAPILVDSLLEVEELDEAEALLHRAFAEPEGVTRNWYYVTPLLRARGKLLSRQERWDEATRTLQEAIERAQAYHLVLVEGQGWMDLGALHARKGEPAQAAACLKRAEDIFQKLGARPYLERVQEMLKELPSGTRR